MKQPLVSSAVVAVLVGALAAQAHGPGPEYVPIARLIQNLNAAMWACAYAMAPCSPLGTGLPWYPEAQL